MSSKLSTKLSLGLRVEVLGDKVEVVLLRSRMPFISRLDNLESDYLFHHESFFGLQSWDGDGTVEATSPKMVGRVAAGTANEAGVIAAIQYRS